MAMATPWCVSVTPDVFQDRLHAVIKTVPGVTGIADDFFGQEDTEIYHDITVLSLLKTAGNNSLKFKIQFMMKKCKYFWTVSHPR